MSHKWNYVLASHMTATTDRCTIALSKNVGQWIGINSPREESLMKRDAQGSMSESDRHAFASFAYPHESWLIVVGTRTPRNDQL